jgi:flavin-dependent dehydrogenase
LNVLDAEVLVVGGGPAGAATAALLARRGRDVLLLEKSAFPREKPCGEYYGPGVVDALARLGALDAVLSTEHEQLGGMRIRVGQRGFLLSYPDEGGHRGALGVRRSLLDRALLHHARMSGVRVAEQARVSGAEIEGNRVRGVRLRGVGGKAGEVLRSRFVVAADGRHSAIARSLGLDLPVRWPRRLGLHAHYSRVALRFGGLGEMHVGRGTYCGLAPVGGGLVVAGLVVPLGAKLPGESAECHFERGLAELPGVAALLDGARQVGPVRGIGPLARRVCRAAGPSYLLVGDAAGFLDPFTGEGVYRALRGAELAAGAVERALRRPDGVPVDYEQARRAAFADKERLVRLIQLVLGSPRSFGYVVGNLGRRPRSAVLIKGVLGDYRPARPALNPGYLWSLLRP